MSTARLPRQPSLDQLRNQARELQQAARSGQADALVITAEHLPGLSIDETFPLHLAQLALARNYGFPSWRQLKEQVKVLQHYSRWPVHPTSAEPLEQFLGNAVLLYTDEDSADRRRQARTVLAEHPHLTTISIHAAAAAADHRAIADLLAADTGLAGTQGGPRRWEPLLYLCYSRLDPEVPVGDVVTSAGLLLAAGADPNAGFLWFGEPTAFTALTGVFGDGEQGSENQPPHPHAMLLARLLLEAGADPNDAQTLYNRMFNPADDHLEVLFEYGLGRGDGGPWHARLPHSTDTPAELLRAQLIWAVTHGMVERIALLARHGVDLVTPMNSGTSSMVTPLTPMQVALLSGRQQSVSALTSLGVQIDSDPVATMAGALLDGNAEVVAAVQRSNPELLNDVRRTHPSLVLRAAVADRLDAVRLLVERGFDINARGRQDILREQEWETALHHAAGEGKFEMAALLLDLGADPLILDHRFQSTPATWAEHFGRVALVDLFARHGGKTSARVD